MESNIEGDIKSFLNAIDERQIEYIIQEEIRTDKLLSEADHLITAANNDLYSMSTNNSALTKAKNENETNINIKETPFRILKNKSSVQQVQHPYILMENSKPSISKSSINSNIIINSNQNIEPDISIKNNIKESNTYESNNIVVPIFTSTPIKSFKLKNFNRELHKTIESSKFTQISELYSDTSQYLEYSRDYLKKCNNPNIQNNEEILSYSKKCKTESFYNVFDERLKQTAYDKIENNIEIKIGNCSNFLNPNVSDQNSNIINDLVLDNTFSKTITPGLLEMSNMCVKKNTFQIFNSSCSEKIKNDKHFLHFDENNASDKNCCSDAKEFNNFENTIPDTFYHRVTNMNENGTKICKNDLEKHLKDNFYEAEDEDEKTLISKNDFDINIEESNPVLKYEFVADSVIKLSKNNNLIKNASLQFNNEIFVSDSVINIPSELLASMCTESSNSFTTSTKVEKPTLHEMLYVQNKLHTKTKYNIMKENQIYNLTSEIQPSIKRTPLKINPGIPKKKSKKKNKRKQKRKKFNKSLIINKSTIVNNLPKLINMNQKRNNTMSKNVINNKSNICKNLKFTKNDEIKMHNKSSNKVFKQNTATNDKVEEIIILNDNAEVKIFNIDELIVLDETGSVDGPMKLVTQSRNPQIDQTFQRTIKTNDFVNNQTTDTKAKNFNTNEVIIVNQMECIDCPVKSISESRISKLDQNLENAIKTNNFVDSVSTGKKEHLKLSNCISNKHFFNNEQKTSLTTLPDLSCKPTKDCPSTAVTSCGTDLSNVVISSLNQFTDQTENDNVQKQIKLESQEHPEPSTSKLYFVKTKKPTQNLQKPFVFGDAVLNEDTKSDSNLKVQFDNTFIDDVADQNFTRLIFDAQKTIDENDPNWKDIRDMRVPEEFFNHVCFQWQTGTLPNPHKNLTKKYIDHPPTYKHNHGAQSNKYKSILLYYNNKIQILENKINLLKQDIHNAYRRKFQKKNIEQRLQAQIDKISKEILALKKNKEELYEINKFYFENSSGWNAQYLNSTEMADLNFQDSVFNFINSFYKM